MSGLKTSSYLSLKLFTVLRVKGLKLPFPQQTTVVTCTLNNGIHVVTTPECKLEKNCPIEQEFEL